MGFDLGSLGSSLGNLVTGGLSSVASAFTNPFSGGGAFLNPLSGLSGGGLLSTASGVTGGAVGPLSAAGAIMPGETGGTPGGGGPMDILKKLGLGGNMGGSGSLLDIASGIFGLNRANKVSQVGADAAGGMNPFGGERAGYAAKLRELYANPTSVANLPGYKAGLDAVTRSMAAQGYLSSGNMMTALQDYGGKAFNDEASRLALLSGAGFAPAGGNLQLAGQQSANDLMGKSLGTLGFAGAGGGIMKLLGNASGFFGNLFGGGGAGTTVGADAGSLLGEEGLSALFSSLGEDAGMALLAI